MTTLVCVAEIELALARHSQIPPAIKKHTLAPRQEAQHTHTHTHTHTTA